MAFDQVSDLVASQEHTPAHSIDRIHESFLRNARDVVENVEAGLRHHGIPFHEEMQPCPELFDTPVIKILVDNDGRALPPIDIFADSEPMVEFNRDFYTDPGNSIDEIVDAVCKCCKENGMQVIDPARPQPRRGLPFAKLAKFIPGRK